MVLKLIWQTLLCLVVLSLEQVLGVPMLFFALVLWFSHGQATAWGKHLLWLISGLALSLIYHQPLISGWILVLVLAWLWQFSQRWLKSDALRLVLWSIVGSAVIALASGFHWTPASLISVSLSLVLTGLFAQMTFFVGSSSGRHRLQSLKIIRSSSVMTK